MRTPNPLAALVAVPIRTAAAPALFLPITCNAQGASGSGGLFYFLGIPAIVILALSVFFWLAARSLVAPARQAKSFFGAVSTLLLGLLFAPFIVDRVPLSIWSTLAVFTAVVVFGFIARWRRHK